MRKYLALTIISLFFFTVTGPVSFGMSLIRDTEIEECLTDMAIKIFKVAGIPAKSAKVFVVNSSEINAFTIGNGYIFVNSGLLLKTKDPLHLMGILAHETAHIAAGHVSRLMASIESRKSHMTTVLLAGILGTVVTGSEAFMAAILGYGQTDMLLFLRYSRGEEFAADALAASYLQKLGFNSECICKTFQKFQDLELLNGGEYVPHYVKSHPSPFERIQAIKNLSKPSGFWKVDSELAERYRRVVLKLKAYTCEKNSEKDDYSIAIWKHRHGQTIQSVQLLQNLVKKEPGNVFYRETLAQCLFEQGKIGEAVTHYKFVYQHHPSPLINIGYAEALIASGKGIDIAIRILEKEKYKDSLENNIYRLLAKAYGCQKKEGISFFMLAQEQICLGNYFQAKVLLERCLRLLDKKKDASYVKKAKYFITLINREVRHQ
ncbi:MAG: hypothetical protein E7015_03570 [Alphaproteobacteria bacterium]|nr:hypothetical protein [Alphaproteobacteria bacterium]